MNKYKESKFCQKCRKETKELFEVPFDKYTTIKVCFLCYEKHKKLIK